MKKSLSQGIFILLSLAVFVGVIFYTKANIVAQSERPIPKIIKEQQFPKISVTEVTPKPYTAKISGFGELMPHYSLTMTSQVSGQVVTVSPQFEVGNTVKKGEWLVKVDQSDYIAAVKEAEKNLAIAKVALLEEQRQVIQAKSEWNSSGFKGEPDSALVLRGPQLREAKANVEFNQAQVKRAKNDLNKTIIKAPFDGVITQRDVSLGSTLQTGNSVASIYSTDRLEVSVPLSNKDWLLIGDAPSSNKVSLTNVETKQMWNGRILRPQQHVNETSRQRALIVAIDKPLEQKTKAYAGSFVEVAFDGNTINSLWKLPSSAMSQRGEIWYISADNTLAKFEASPLFSRDGAIFISPPLSMMTQAYKVVSHPLNSYVHGMQVTPLVEHLNAE